MSEPRERDNDAHQMEGVTPHPPTTQRIKDQGQVSPPPPLLPVFCSCEERGKERGRERVKEKGREREGGRGREGDRVRVKREG